ncbi:MAG: hypothetical protein ACR2NM_12410 [Bythopirellula sp.]
MFPTWRLKVREARMALKAGRPDEAGQILQQESVRDFLPAKRLSHEVAKHLVSRAEQHLQLDDSIASWSDLQQAARLGGCDDRVAELRQAQTERGLDRVRRAIQRGDTKLATDQIQRLEQRRLGGEQRRVWKLIVHLISRAKELSAQGKSTGAGEMLQRATQMLPDPQDELADQFAARQEQLQQQADELRRLSGQLHEKLTAEAWTEVLTTAEAMLELAPEHKAARQARSKAWDAVGMKATRVVPQKQIHRIARSLQSTHAWASSAKVDTKAMQNPLRKGDTSRRFVTWIDGVGGYLICLGDEVMLGQPSGIGGAEISILADLSRRHASIRREGEAYVIQPVHRVSVDGTELTGPQVLNDDALIELGPSVRLRFRKPHALSGTAVLTLESHHKTEPAVDGIVLMSESCVFGSRAQSHVTCRGWEDDLVLFRRGGELQFRTAASVEINGEPPAAESAKTGGGVITGNTRVDGEGFSLSFEEV